MTMTMTRRELLDEAVRMGVPAKPSWSKSRLESEITKARAGAGPQAHETLVQRATSLGLTVPPAWDDHRVEDAILAYEEAAAEDPYVSPTAPPVRPWRPGSPRG